MIDRGKNFEAASNPLNALPQENESVAEIFCHFLKKIENEDQKGEIVKR